MPQFLLAHNAAPITLLLLLSNVFMTFAWYGHLKFKATPLWAAVIGGCRVARAAAHPSRRSLRSLLRVRSVP